MVPEDSCHYDITEFGVENFCVFLMKLHNQIWSNLYIRYIWEVLYYKIP